MPEGSWLILSGALVAAAVILILMALARLGRLDRLINGF